jgi:hypothetical protein
LSKTNAIIKENLVVAFLFYKRLKELFNMMDWNQDGKHDYKDDSFFYNVVLKNEEENNSNEKELTSNKTTDNSSRNYLENPGSFLAWLLFLIPIILILVLL